MKLIIQHAKQDDIDGIFNLYKLVSKSIGGIAREEDEITRDYIKNIVGNSLKNGLCLIAIDRKNDIIAEIHCYKLKPRVFDHVLSELTIVVHPKFQNKGIGKLIFSKLLHCIEETRHDILRVELIARESNKSAIEFYKKLGFKAEGRFELRIDNKTKQFEADIPMAWFNRNYKNKYPIA